MLVSTCAVNGGHLAPNLGVVELTLALHRVLDLPHDKLVWDVSHQTYVHKILTGRRDRFETFAKAAALRLCDAQRVGVRSVRRRARRRRRSRRRSAWRTARDLPAATRRSLPSSATARSPAASPTRRSTTPGALEANFIVILNDNEMSIAPNVGSIASYLSVLRTNRLRTSRARPAKDVLDHFRSAERAQASDFESAEIGAMRFVSPDGKDGGDLRGAGVPVHRPDRRTRLRRARRRAANTRKAFARPVLLHVRTVKGKGFEPAETRFAHVPRRRRRLRAERRQAREDRPARSPEVSRRFRRLR